jgi:hypothetical protein
MELAYGSVCLNALQWGPAFEGTITYYCFDWLGPVVCTHLAFIRNGETYRHFVGHLGWVVSLFKTANYTEHKGKHADASVPCIRCEVTISALQLVTKFQALNYLPSRTGPSWHYTNMLQVGWYKEIITTCGMANLMALRSSQGALEDPFSHFVLRCIRLFAETAHKANTKLSQKE